MAENEGFFVGLDLSLNHSGLCFLHSNGTDDTFLIEPKKIRGYKRLGYIQDELKLAFYKHQPILGVCIEGYAFAAKGIAFTGLCELGGIIRLMLFQAGYESFITPSSVLKKYATGIGNCDKELVIKSVNKTWKKDFNDDNLADAFTLAKISEQLVKFKNQNLLLTVRKVE